MAAETLECYATKGKCQPVVMLLDCPEAIAPKPFSSSSPLHDVPRRCLAATFKYFTETIVSTTRVRKMLLFSRPAALEVRDRKKRFQARLEQKLLPLLSFFAPMGICGRDKKSAPFRGYNATLSPLPTFLGPSRYGASRVSFTPSPLQVQGKSSPPSFFGHSSGNGRYPAARGTEFTNFKL